MDIKSAAVTATMHSVVRTSAMGEKFTGRCTLCGAEGLTLADMDQTCPNPRGVSQETAFINAVDGRIND